MAYEIEIAYWRKKLGGELPPLQIYSKKARASTEAFTSGSASLAFSAELTKQLTAFADKNNVTRYAVLLTLFKILLVRYTQQYEIIIGTSTLDLLANIRVLRDQVSKSANFLSLLKQVQRTIDEARQYGDIAFEKILAELQPTKVDNKSPLFQAKFDFYDDEKFEPKKNAYQGKVDLALTFERKNAKFVTTLEYNSALFKKYFVEGMLAHFQVLLLEAFKNPKKNIFSLPLLTDKERKKILLDWNNTKTPFPNKSIHELFEKQAALTPNVPAVSFVDSSLSYAELNKKANQLAHYLIGQGVAKEDIVAILLEPSPETYIALLAVLKAGAAYLPIDPNLSADRLAHMLNETHAKIVLTQQSLMSKLAEQNVQAIYLDRDAKIIAEEKPQNPRIKIVANQLACVIYRFNDAGVPQGILLEHRGVSSLSTLRSFDKQAERQCVVQFNPFASDAAITDFFIALLRGDELLILPPDMMDASMEWVNFLSAKQVKAAIFPTSLLITLPPEKLTFLQTVIALGEPLPLEVANRWAKGRHLFQAYGFAETTIWTTLNEHKPTDKKVTLGRPINNMEIYILDANMQAVPISLPGELHIGGVGLARGYSNRPELTAEKFIKHPFSSSRKARLYKTGVLARYLPDGQIEYLSVSK